MDAKTEIVALAVRLLSNKTDMVRPANSFDELFATILTGKTHDVRTAEQIIESSEKIANFVKTNITNRKFKKITKNI